MLTEGHQRRIVQVCERQVELRVGFEVHLKKKKYNTYYWYFGTIVV